MSYKALYRSYRPTNFGEVIGQKHVIQTLKNALKEDKISHAYAFCGLRGIGKTTIARILAKAVNCLNLNNGEPCNECANCKAIDENATTDIIELDAASNNGVDEIRNILDKVNFLPSTLKKKVYIIDEVHMLSTAAFNALLKTLEEPPAYVMFILATTEPHKIPMTILSRCQRFDFKQLTLEELTVELELICEKEGIQITDEALSKISEAAEGGMRDALSILDQASVYAKDKVTSDDVDAVTGNVSNNKLIELIKAFNNDDATLAINIVNDLLNMGKEVTRLITNVVQFARDLLLFKSVDPTEFNKAIYKNEEFKALALESDARRLFYYIDVLVDVQNKIRFTNSQKIYLEVGIMKIINRATEDIDILGKIKELEERINNTTPYDESNPNPNMEQKLLIIDNKIKKINADLERMNIKGFKEEVMSKVNMLEDVTSNSSTIPLLQDRLTIIENKVNELELNPISNQYNEIDNNNETNNVEINKMIEDLRSELKANLESLKQEIQAKETPQEFNDIYNKEENNNNQEVNFQSFDDKLNNLEKRITDLEELYDSNSKEEDIFGTVQPDNTELMNSINQLKKDVELLKQAKNEKEEETDIFGDNEELSLPTKRINPYKIMDEEENSSTQSLDDIYHKLDNVVTEVELLKNKPSINLENIENKIRNLEEKINSSDNNALAESLKELKTNYFLLSQTVEYMHNTQSSTDNKELIERIEKLENNFSIYNKERKELNPIQEENIKPIVEEQPVVKEEKEEVIVKEPVQEVSEVVQETKEVDLTEKIYDANIVCEMLNESYSPEFRKEKDILKENWSNIEDKASGLDASLARMLASGELRVCANNKILIAYPTAQICNQLMSPERHEQACAILKEAFGKDYYFMALPDDVWMEKRIEYLDQRKIGITKPTLKPFNDPQLKIVQSNKQLSMSEREKTIKKADEFFGD